MKQSKRRTFPLWVRVCRVALWVGVCAAWGAASVSALAADFSSWTGQMRIAFTGYTRPEALSNFPALVVFSNRPGFAYSQFLSGSNADLRFADATLTRELNYEVETWNTNGVSLVWVQVPRLAGTNTTLWAYWGKTGQSVPACATNGAVWEGSFRGVWHLDETVTDETAVGRHYDSTSNHFDGAQDGNGPVGGVIGSAQGFDGNDKITMGAVVNLNAYTKEAWVRVTANGNLMSSGNSHAFWVPSGNLQAGHNGDWGAVAEPIAFPVGSWQHVAVTYDAAVNGGQLALYHNGSQVAVATGKVPPGPDAIAYLGSHGGANFFAGQIDEARISCVARSSNWIWACWMNQASNAVFATTTVGVPVIQNAAPSDVTATSAVLNGVLVSNRMSSSYVTVYWGTNDAGTAARDWQFSGPLRGLQAAGPVSRAVSGLAPNRTYFYTYCASNASGIAWTQPSLAFETWGPPAVDNDGGAEVADDASAALRGTLLEGHAAQAAIYWGTNPAALTNVSRLGLVTEGPFAVTLPPLQKSDTYHYRCFVSNVYGTAWADSATNFSILLSQILKLEQNAEFGKAVVLCTTALNQVRDAVTLETLRALMAKLKEEKRAALDLGLAIDSLETHRDIAERELAKDPEVGALLLRQAVRQRDGKVLINAAAILTAMNDPATPALLVGRLATCREPEVFAALFGDLDQLKESIVPSLVPGILDAAGNPAAGEGPAVSSILAYLGGKELGRDIVAAVYRQAREGATFRNRRAAAWLDKAKDGSFRGDAVAFGEAVGDPGAAASLAEYLVRPVAATNAPARQDGAPKP